MSRNTILLSIKSVITYTYKSATDKDCRAVKIKTHEVQYFTSLQEELSGPAGIEGWNLVFSDIIVFLFKRCYLQA